MPAAIHPHEATICRCFDACYAAPAVKDIPIGERVDFDYAGRGDHLRCD